MDHIDIKISSNDCNQSIKSFLKNNHIGRGRIEYLRVNKFTFINGEATSLETQLKENDILTLNFQEEINFLSFDKSIDVIYEDEYLLAVSKPANIIIHPDNKESGNGTLSNIVAKYYADHNINRNVRYLHRLDKETTGVVLFAKDFYTEAKLLQDIESNNIERIYIGYINGHLSMNKGVINAEIGEDRHYSNKMTIVRQGRGKPSKTEYKVIKSFKDYSKVEFKLCTGRTHQIRVHSSYINHPLLGDMLYGKYSKYISRVALHCYKLAFIHPITDKKIEIISPLPNDLLALEKLH